MYKEASFLAIVPARQGSKRIPNKNILPLGGKPLITYSIESAIKSNYIDQVVVSSDSQEILSIAQSLNVLPLLRPDALSSDTASAMSVIKHAIDEFKRYDYIVYLQPTSPLRDENHIDEAIELLTDKGAKAVISVCESDCSPLWAGQVPEDGNMTSFLQGVVTNKRSQDLEKYYSINGAIYICNTEHFLQEKTLFIKNDIYAYRMDKKASVDIDEPLDFEWADFLLSKIQCK